MEEVNNRLRGWLALHRISQGKLARLFGAAPSSISAYINGQSPWPVVYAFALEEMTQGEVTARDLLLLPRYRQSPLSALRGEE